MEESSVIHLINRSCFLEHSAIALLCVSSMSKAMK